MNVRCWIAATALVAVWALPLQANPYGNPVPPLEGGETAIGVAASQMTRDIFIEDNGTQSTDISRVTGSFNFGFAGRKRLQLGLASVTATPEDFDTFSGGEGVISYRQQMGSPIDAGGLALAPGLLVSLRGGTIEDDVGGIDYYQFDLGVGGSAALSQALDAYGGVVYSEIAGTRWFNEFDTEQSVESEENVGLFAGVGIAASPGLEIDAELHLIHEFGFALELLIRL